MFCKLCVVVVLMHSFMVADILTDAQNSFISKSINLTTLIGETVEFNCSEYNMESLKYTTQLIWLKNEEPLRYIIRKNSNRIFLDALGDTLKITNVTNEDAGSYKCNTFNQSHNDYSIFTLTVNGLPKPKTYHMTTYNITASIERPVNIICMKYMYYDDSRTYQNHAYFKDGKPLFLNESNEKMRIDEDSDLQINNLTHEDTGTYECVTSNKFRIDHSITNLNVVDERIQKNLYEIINQTKHLNEILRFRCYEGTWFKNDKPFKSSNESSHITFYDNNREFGIDNLAFEDAGIYRCNTSFEHKTVSLYYTLNVIDSPEKLSFRLFTSNISAVFGKTIQLRCHIFQSAIHYKTWYSWIKNGEQLVLNNDSKNMYFRNDRSILEISNLTSNDIGSYECEAESFYHKVYSAYTLTISGVNLK